MSLNLNNLVYSSQNFSIIFQVPGATPFPLLTVANITFKDNTEYQDIWAVGQQDPIANKVNANSYSGTFKLQVGEWNDLLALSGLKTGIGIKNATLSVAHLILPFAKTYINVYISDDSEAINAKDKETLADITWNALGVQ